MGALAGVDEGAAFEALPAPAAAGPAVFPEADGLPDRFPEAAGGFGLPVSRPCDGADLLANAPLLLDAEPDACCGEVFPGGALPERLPSGGASLMSDKLALPAAARGLLPPPT